MQVLFIKDNTMVQLNDIAHGFLAEHTWVNLQTGEGKDQGVCHGFSPTGQPTG